MRTKRLDGEEMNAYSRKLTELELEAPGVVLSPDGSWADRLDTATRYVIGLESRRLAGGGGPVSSGLALTDFLHEELDITIPTLLGQLGVLLTLLPRGHHLPLWRQIRLVTLTAEGIVMINGGQKAGDLTLHNGKIEPGGPVDKLLDRLLILMDRRHACQNDMAQIHDALEAAGMAVKGFEADGTWGDLSIASIDNCRGQGHKLYTETTVCADCGGALTSTHHKRQCTTGSPT